MSANSNANYPTFTAFVVTERTGKKNIWTPIGAAWPNKDGKGFNIKLHALPINGQIVLREPLQDENELDEDERLANRGGRRDDDIQF